MKAVNTNKPFAVCMRHNVFNLADRRKARGAIARIAPNQFASERQARDLIGTLSHDVQPLLDVSRLVGFA
ncbi:hypothetical protein [Burkholderia ubonensis]|uniref:hypothetical protein n=1 Tax=Burkholderia ubonensis TaxID=101571 RepID=UPI000752735E|nr:hypothetical protein [Burkholderia ubonensis]